MEEAPGAMRKLNVDGSFCGASSTGGIRMVLRDDVGSIIVSVCRFLQTCQSPLEAEEACRHGVSLAIE
jgi:hypothetical protein